MLYATNKAVPAHSSYVGSYAASAIGRCRVTLSGTLYLITSCQCCLVLQKVYSILAASNWADWYIALARKLSFLPGTVHEEQAVEHARCHICWKFSCWPW